MDRIQDALATLLCNQSKAKDVSRISGETPKTVSMIISNKISIKKQNTANAQLIV